MTGNTDLRHPDILTDEQTECLLSGYVYKDRALEYLRSGRKVRETTRSHGETVGVVGIGVELGPWETYNPNFCENCGRITNHTADGRCGIFHGNTDGCGKQNPNVTTLRACQNCHDGTLQSLRDAKEWTCLKCGRTEEHHEFVDSVSKRELQYRRWTGNASWKYDAGEYWSFVRKQMYQMVVDGRSLPEIASEFDMKEGSVRSHVRDYCKANGLQSPWKRKSDTEGPEEEKPNGRSCLACGRPLFGRELKWCHNKDCEGYYALHPEKKLENPEEQLRLWKIKYAKARVDELRSSKALEPAIAEAERAVGMLEGKIEPFHETCSRCGRDIRTNLTKDSFGNWSFVCQACGRGFRYSDTLVLPDVFGNLLVRKMSKEPEKRDEETKEYLRRLGALPLDTE